MRGSIQGAETVNNPLSTAGAGSAREKEAAPKKEEKEKRGKKRCSGLPGWSVFGERESGRDLQQNLDLAINASQLFYLVIAAVKPLLPQSYLEIVLPLAAFFALDLWFDLTLVFHSLNPEEFKWYQLLFIVLLTVVCCWFLLSNGLWFYRACLQLCLLDLRCQ